MIITRSPLRISLGGGGTDLPSYYEKNEGFLIAASIDKYVYTFISSPFKKGIFLKYSDIENVQTIDQINHPIIRESLKELGFNNKSTNIEISSIADLPSGTGLGSSGSFTTSLLKGLLTYSKNNVISDYDLAELACKVEIDRLKDPIGKQDQYIASYGGISAFSFKKNGEVDVNSVNISNDTIFDLEDNLLLFFTGMSRSAGSILKDQNTKSKSDDKKMLANLDNVKEMGYKSREFLEKGETNKFAELMHDHWLNKRKRSNNMTNDKIDEWYQIGLQNGAIGGKLVGAGGGGFLMFYAKDKQKLIHAMEVQGLHQVRFRFDFEGTKIISQ
jgi:D-glycero-alpha-D-manno-heptose-7-phosphate kinase